VSLEEVLEIGVLMAQVPSFDVGFDGKLAPSQGRASGA
jgi:hypothetical protein